MAKQTFTTGQVLTAAQMTSLQQTAMGGGSATAKTASYVLVAADAGATVIMNAAGATTITVNTSLFSAGDTVFIQNIGAGITTITAGTATVSTASSLALAQYESGNLYFTATGVSIFSKSDGAGAAGGGLTLLQTLSASGASVTSSSIAATYKSLYVVGRGLSTSANSNIWCRVNGDSGSNYLYRSTRNGNTLSLDASSGENRIYFGIIGTGTAYTSVCSFELSIPRYAQTEYKTILVENSAQAAAFDWWSNRNGWNNTAAITTITIGVNDTFASGSIYIYGVN